MQLADVTNLAMFYPVIAIVLVDSSKDEIRRGLIAPGDCCWETGLHLEIPKGGLEIFCALE